MGAKLRKLLKICPKLQLINKSIAYFFDWKGSMSQKCVNWGVVMFQGQSTKNPLSKAWENRHFSVLAINISSKDTILANQTLIITK